MKEITLNDGTVLNNDWFRELTKGHFENKKQHQKDVQNKKVHFIFSNGQTTNDKNKYSSEENE